MGAFTLMKSHRLRTTLLPNTGSFNPHINSYTFDIVTPHFTDGITEAQGERFVQSRVAHYMWEFRMFLSVNASVLAALFTCHNTCKSFFVIEPCKHEALLLVLLDFWLHPLQPGAFREPRKGQ